MTSILRLGSAESDPSIDFRVLEVGLETISFRKGGLNRYFSQLVRSLDQLGVSVRTIAVGHGPADDEDVGGIVVEAYGSTLFRLIALRAAGQKEVEAADIVDAHFALTALPLLTGLLRNRPLVIHFQGPWADESAAVGEAKLVSALKRVVERLVYHRASALVVLSHSFRRLLIERYGLAPWNIEVIHPGVNMDHFKPGDQRAARSLLGVSELDPAVVTVRRLVPRMGLDVMADAWAEVAPRLGGRAHWFVVGDGPGRSDLEERIARLGIEANVHFLGAVDDDLLVKCYQAANLSVVPSLGLEGFGLSALESLACGTPVVASDVGGLREAIGSLGTNLVVPPGQASILAERLHQALSGTIEVPSSAECRSYAEHYSWNEVAQKHVTLFREVLSRQLPRRTGPRHPADRRDMRVVVVGHTAVLSGGELAMVRLIEARRGVRVHVILAEYGPLVSLLEEAGATVEVLPLHPRARGIRRDQASPRLVPMRSLLTTLLYTVRLVRRLRQINPDLVHTNTLKAAIYGGVAAKLARRPCLWHIRDRISEDYLPMASVRVIRLMARIVPTEIVVDSETTLATLGRGGNRVRQLGRVPAVSVVPSPTPLNNRRRRRTDDGSTLSVVMLGRLAPWKGQDVFLRAFAQAFEGGPERAIVAGSALFGDDPYAQSLVDLVDSLGIGDQVDLRGFVRDVPQLLAEADVLVHASILPEPFGQVIVEGMAAGLAVVATDQGGPSEIITNGFDGLLLPAGNVNSLSETLLRLAGDSELRLILGDNAKVNAMKYAPDIIAEKMLAIYTRVAARGDLKEVDLDLDPSVVVQSG